MGKKKAQTVSNSITEIMTIGQFHFQNSGNDFDYSIRLQYRSVPFFVIFHLREYNNHGTDYVNEYYVYMRELVNVYPV